MLYKSIQGVSDHQAGLIVLVFSSSAVSIQELAIWSPSDFGSLDALDIPGLVWQDPPDIYWFQAKSHWKQPNEGRNTGCMTIWVCLNIEYVPQLLLLFLTCLKKKRIFPVKNI